MSGYEQTWPQPRKMDPAAWVLLAMGVLLFVVSMALMDTLMFLIIVPVLVAYVLMLAGAYFAMKSKGRPFGAGFALVLLLGPVGAAIVAFMPSR